MADQKNKNQEILMELVREHNKELDLTDREIEFILSLRELNQENLEAFKTYIAKECLKHKSMNQVSAFKHKKGSFDIREMAV